MDIFSFFERAVLACMLLQSNLIPYVASVLTSNNFHYYSNAVIFIAIVSLHTSTAIDFPILLNYFIVRYIDINYSYVLSLFYLKCNVSNIQYYIALLLKRSMLLRLRLNVCMLADFLRATDFPNEDYVILKLQEIFKLLPKQAIAKPVNCLPTVKGFLKKLLLTGPDIAFVTGFQALDNIILGIKPGDLVIVAGRPATGKTTFCLDILRYNALVKRATVCILSLEMTANQLLIKLISALTMLTTDSILNYCLSNVCFSRVLTACNLLAQSAIYINDLSQITLTDIYCYLKNLKFTLGGALLVVIDYIQLVGSGGIFTTNNSDTVNISSALKRIAKELGLAIIIISQLNRRIEYRQSKVPLLSDLRDSGTLEQDADLVLFLSPLDSLHTSAYVRVFVSKNRNGGTGVVNLKFLKKYNCFLC
ncbi:AAA family ATPase [Candidatus Vidania fulgoroideae]|nr:AAA family ATPase [Candidatus Vidania fulgoroideae]